MAKRHYGTTGGSGFFLFGILSDRKRIKFAARATQEGLRQQAVGLLPSGNAALEAYVKERLQEYDRAQKWARGG